MVQLDHLKGNDLAVSAVDGFVYSAVSAFSELVAAFIAPVTLFFLFLHISVAFSSLII